MKSRNWFIGIIFVAVGVLSLLASLDVIDFSWRIAWRLWPLLLIFVGVAVLLIKDWLKAVLMLVALAIGVLLYQYEYNNGSHHWLFSQSVDNEKVEMPIA